MPPLRPAASRCSIPALHSCPLRLLEPNAGQLCPAALIAQRPRQARINPPASALRPAQWPLLKLGWHPAGLCGPAHLPVDPGHGRHVNTSTIQHPGLCGECSAAGCWASRPQRRAAAAGARAGAQPAPPTCRCLPCSPATPPLQVNGTPSAVPLADGCWLHTSWRWVTRGGVQLPASMPSWRACHHPYALTRAFCTGSATSTYNEKHGQAQADLENALARRTHLLQLGCPMRCTLPSLPLLQWTKTPSNLRPIESPGSCTVRWPRLAASVQWRSRQISTAADPLRRCPSWVRPCCADPLHCWCLHCVPHPVRAGPPAQQRFYCRVDACRPCLAYKAGTLPGPHPCPRLALPITSSPAQAGMCR